MTKKINKEPLEGLPDIDKLTVQKSRPLTALWQSDLTLPQFKILDLYLSRIDSHKPEKRLVRFSKGEIEELLGVDRIRRDDLDKRLDGLYQGIPIDHPDLKGFRKVGLFELAECTIDQDGLWTIDLQCTQAAMKYNFDVEHLGYIRYKLRSIVAIKSRYAYILFIYLEQNRFRKSWEIGLDELKNMLGAVEPTYNEFFRFREKVLDRARAELHEKTELRFSYTPVRRGRKVTAIHFEVETLPALDPADPDQVSMLDWMTGEDNLDDLDRDLWETAVEELALTEKQLKELCSVLVLVPRSRLPIDPVGTGSLEIQRYHYMDLKYRELKRRDEKDPIKHKYEYLLKMVRQDIKQND